MEFSYRQNGRKGVVHLKTTRQLTDRDWHLITIEQSPNTVRFSVDMENEVVMLKEGEKVKAYDGPFLLGGSLSTEVMDDPNVQGMVGCIAGLIINNRVKYLADIYTIQQSVVREGMAVGCSTLCHENTCKNGGRCIERFTSYECVCLDRATSGEHCEINYNDDVVSFPEGNTYLSIDLTNSSIFTSSFFVGFRTLSSNALLLYAEDNFSNFVSLEISHGQLKMTWNSNRVIRNIILKREVREFSDGDWLEVSVERDEQGVSLIVGDEKATTLAPRGLLDQFYSDPFSQGIAKPSAPNAFVKLYVGGKPNSKVNALKGCIRGLVVANQPIRLQGSYKPGVLEKCENHCLPRPCLNGGICMETWYDFYCNCTMTSYAGKQCEEGEVYDSM
ncbi:contactin-associated protein like 5-3-like [Anneissia japonica]|uniref:contactin-associated protein like 5-3-like n=1 Tax=Anneissia japonica TaxID=1529436 RepID=UPI00142554A5|nr:contactin-associated protein like 5-3-like [Anneissia japonica]